MDHAAEPAALLAHGAHRAHVAEHDIGKPRIVAGFELEGDAEPPRRIVVCGGGAGKGDRYPGPRDVGRRVDELEHGRLSIPHARRGTVDKPERRARRRDVVEPGGVALRADDDVDRRRGRQPAGAAAFRPLGDDAQAGAGDQQVDELPQPGNAEQTGDLRLGLVTVDAHRHAGEADHEHDEIGQREFGCVVPAHVLALCRDVEGRLARRRDHRRNRRQQEDRLGVLVELGDPRPAQAAEERGADHLAGDEIGHRIGEELFERGNVDLEVEKDEQQWREEEAGTGEGEQPEHAARQVAQALRKAQAALEQRILEQQDLDHAAAPARTLADECREGLGLQAAHQRLVDIDAVPALGMEFERRFAVFGDRDAGKAA